MHFAIFEGSLNLIEYLVNHGAEINSINNNGKTALSIAIGSKKGLIVEYLKANGAIDYGINTFPNLVCF